MFFHLYLLYITKTSNRQRCCTADVMRVWVCVCVVNKYVARPHPPCVQIHLKNNNERGGWVVVGGGCWLLQDSASGGEGGGAVHRDGMSHVPRQRGRLFLAVKQMPECPRWK